MSRCVPGPQRCSWFRSCQASTDSPRASRRPPAAAHSARRARNRSRPTSSFSQRDPRGWAGAPRTGAGRRRAAGAEGRGAMRRRVAEIRSKRNGCGIKHSRVGRAAVRPCKQLVALAAAAAACATKDDPAARQRPAPLVAVAHPRVRDVEVAVRAPVDLRPFLTADIGSKTLGYLDAVLVDRGDAVKKGQVVALVRPSDLPDQLAAARGALAQAEAAAALARANKQRAEMLAPDGVVSQQELQQATTAAAQTEATLAGAKAQASGIAVRLGETRIDSPLDGVVLQRRLDPGALVGPTAGT